MRRSFQTSAIARKKPRGARVAIGFISTCEGSEVQYYDAHHLWHLCSSVPPEPLKEVTRNLSSYWSKLNWLLHGCIDNSSINANVRIKSTHMSTTSKHILEPLAKEGRRQHRSYACTGSCMYSSKTTFFAKFCDKFTFYSSSAKQDQQTPNMAECYSRPARHFELEHCVRLLEYKNSAEQLEHPAFSRYKIFITSGPDTELLRFQSSLRDHDVKKILLYLRNFEICDLADYERISNDKLFPTSELKVAELVTMISTKDPHAFWYFIHSVKKFRGRNGLFEFFHGNINCCGEFNCTSVSSYREGPVKMNLRGAAKLKLI